MKLQDIRGVQSFDALKPAIRLLCDDMHTMTYGEFIAYKRTLETQCVKLGHTLAEMNNYAIQYQVYGYETDETKQGVSK